MVLVDATGRLRGSGVACGASTAMSGMSPRKAAIARIAVAVRVLIVVAFV